MKIVCFAVAGLFSLAPIAVHAQSQAQATRLGDLQIGAGFTTASSDYVPNRIRGFAFYSDFDFREHVGIEVDFHQLNDPRPTDVYERTYEVGGRYFRRYYGGHVKPYGKVLYGRGVFNFPQSEANLAYNMLVAGAGVDFAVHPRINVRADFEYQRWFGFPPNGLTPTLFTIGAAYHFPAGQPK